MQVPLFSFIVPVYNRPAEVDELLMSLNNLEGNYKFEVLIIEDGSTITSKEVVKKYTDQLSVNYFFKPNTGPGDSRNFGMAQAKGNYFIILDSDCLLPKNYLQTVSESLQNRYLDFFGGPDAAHPSFTPLQKAINFAMTSFLTTGGVRGKQLQAKNFQPRSFNMGISKKAFETSGGFGNIHPGEDPDLTIRLWNLGFKSAFIEKAFVYHKRRISWGKFFKQVHQFGMVRPILNNRYPQYKKFIYWLPSFFVLGLFLSLILVFFNIVLPIALFATYFMLIFIFALFKEKNLKISLLSVYAVFLQFLGYGAGYLLSFFFLNILRKDAAKIFPHLFFKN